MQNEISDLTLYEIPGANTKDFRISFGHFYSIIDHKADLYDGFIFDVSGNPEEDADISAWLPAGVSNYDGDVVSPFKVETATDSLGYFYLDLIPSVDLEPDTVNYEIILRKSDGTILRESVIVPDSSSWKLTW